MKTRMQFENKDSIEATMVMTMTLKDWKALDKELSGVWPASELSRNINDLIAKAATVVWGPDVE